MTSVRPTAGPGPIRVLCAANGSYAMPLCTMLVSLVIHHPRERALEVFILDGGIKAEDRKLIEDSILANVPSFPLESLRWVKVDPSSIKGLPATEYISADTYSRLLAPELLPESIERILYLDCDLVVLADLSPLFDVPGDSLLWAVRDVTAERVSDFWGVFNHAEMGLPPDAPYFNAGVLLMNLRRWRQEKVSERVFEYLRRYPDEVHMHDQGGMNALLATSWTEMGGEWNHMQIAWKPVNWKRGGLKDPKIVHYAGAHKPWHPHGGPLPMPRKIFFYRYLQKTAYRGAMPAPRVEMALGPWWYFVLWHEWRPRLRRWLGRPEPEPARP